MKYIAGFIAFIILAILTVILFGRIIPDSPDTNQNVQQKVELADYINGDAVARLTIDGKIVGREQHRAIRITVGRTGRTVEVLRGYEYEVEQNKQFDNDITAFSIFLKSIDKAGFAIEKQNKSKATPADEDEKGVCPAGMRYIYELLDGTNQVVHSWSTSCGSQQGDFGGKAEVVRQLFQAQIPDYSKITTGVQL